MYIYFNMYIYIYNRLIYIVRRNICTQYTLYYTITICISVLLFPGVDPTILQPMC